MIQFNVKNKNDLKKIKYFFISIAYASGLVEGLATAEQIFDFYLTNLCVVKTIIFICYVFKSSLQIIGRLYRIGSKKFNNLLKWTRKVY